MIAAMISKVIGLLYKSPLSNIIGSLGMGYTSLAQNAYMILLMIASFSIPQAVSKLISERIALKDYRNAHKFFKGAMIYAMVIGGVVGLFCLFGAGLIIPQNQKDAIPALQILAPTIFLSGILGVFRGYFQAYRNMMPTSISQIIEQVFNAAVSLLAAWGFINAFSDGTENSIAKWGAAGSTVGTGAGVVTALAFMLLVYGVNRRKILHRVERDHRHQEESYKEIFRVIILVVSPIILSAFVYNVNAYINGYLFSDILGRRGGDAAQIGILYAEYATYFMTIINIPLTLSSTAPTSMIPEVSALYATGDIEATRECIDQTVQLSMVVSAPCAMGLAVLAQPIVFLLYGNSTGLAANLLILGSFSILLNGMSNISNGVLQAIGQQRIPVITAAIALVVDIVVVVVLLFYYVYYRISVGRKRLLMQKELELYRQEQKFQKESDLKDQKIDSLQEENLQSELRHKSEELIRTTLNIVRKNEILLDIKKEVLGISHSISEENLVSLRRKTLRLLGQIDTNIEHDDDLQGFQSTFDSVHHDFFKKLEEAYPELNNKEKLLCAYIKMNLLSKEIAPLLNISLRGVEISRYRLRKKLGLEEGANLAEFLQKFSK